MNFYEFIEALARCAEKLSLCPISTSKNKIGKINTNNIVERRLLKLEHKFNAFLMLIYFRLGDTIKKTFSDTKDEDLDEFDSSAIPIKKV